MAIVSNETHLLCMTIGIDTNTAEEMIIKVPRTAGNKSTIAKLLPFARGSIDVRLLLTA